MTSRFRSSTDSPSRWPHRLALLLVFVTFPLIWVGGLVTSYDAGMAVPDWPNTYGHNLFLYPWKTWLLGPWDIFVEHGHRLLGAAAGMVAIALVIVTIRCEKRRWVKMMAAGALLLVIFQGVLGGARVLFNSRYLAMIHGFVGPAFFAFCASLAVFTSKWWKDCESDSIASPQTNRAAESTLFQFSWITVLLVGLQLMLGGQIRHAGVDWSFHTYRVLVFAHLTVALLLVGHVVWTHVLTLRLHRGEKAIVRTASALTMLSCLQLLLGGATWVVHYAWPHWSRYFLAAEGYTIEAEGWLQANITTAHVATGSLILALAVVLAIRIARISHLFTGGGDAATKSGPKNLKEVLA